MKAEPVDGVQPAGTGWARESMGMSFEDVAQKLKRPLEELMSREAKDGAAAAPEARLRGMEQ